MAIPDVPSRGIRVASLGWPLTRLVDAVLAAYMEWRGSADAVAAAYRQWAAAPAGERASRFFACTASVDQEQAAAAAYAQSLAELYRRLPPGAADTI